MLGPDPLSAQSEDVHEGEHLGCLTTFAKPAGNHPGCAIQNGSPTGCSFGKKLVDVLVTMTCHQKAHLKALHHVQSGQNAGQSYKAVVFAFSGAIIALQ